MVLRLAVARTLGKYVNLLKTACVLKMLTRLKSWAGAGRLGIDCV